MKENNFITAITDKKVKSSRIHAKQQNGNIGITAWYTDEVIEMIKEDVLKAGHTILKIEEKYI